MSEFMPEVFILLDTKENDNGSIDIMPKIDSKMVGRTRWDGEVPPDSYRIINPYMRMSTPEFFFFRRCGDPTNEDALELAVTLLSHYDSWMTSPKLDRLDRDEFAYRKEPATNESKLRAYLDKVKPCIEKDTALRVLDDALPLVEGFEMAVAECMRRKYTNLRRESIFGCSL